MRPHCVPLVKLETLVVTADPLRLETAFEEIVTHAFGLRDGVNDPGSIRELTRVWSSLGVKVLP